MTKPKRNGFVRLEHELMDSPAWRTAPLGVRCVVLAIWRRHTGKNNGKIPYGRRDAQMDLGCGSHQAVKYLREAEARGFISPTTRSSFAHKKQATTWRLTAEPWNGRPPSDEWRRWSPQKFEFQVPERHHHRCRSGTNPPVQVPERHLTPPVNRCRSDTTSKTKSSYQGEALATNGVQGGPASKAAWLRSWLASGRLTSAEVAATIDLHPGDVEQVASGARRLRQDAWQKLAALVEGRLH